MTTPTTTERDTRHLPHGPIGTAASPSSLQDRARERIEGMIADGSLPAGSRLPPFRELARQLGTSVTPLQRAVRELAAAGLVEVRHGSGVRVLGHRPSASPRAEGAARSNGTLVAVVSRLGPRHDANRWKQRIVSALERELTALGHGVLFFSQLEPGDDGTLLPLEDVLAEALEGAGCGAVALVEPGGSGTTLESIGDRLAVLERPGVWVSGHAHRAPVSSVYYDNDWAGYAAARHLAEHGHREIAAAVLDPSDWGDALRAGGAQGWAAERLEGVRRACRQFGLRLTPLPVRPEDVGGAHLATPGFWARCGESVADAVLDLMATPSWPTALIALNDESAVAFMNRLAAAGCEIPEGLSLVGFDNAEEGRLRRLTTVEPPIEELGEEAARALHRAHAAGADPSAPVQHLLVKPSLIARASVAAPPQARAPRAHSEKPFAYSGVPGA